MVIGGWSWPSTFDDCIGKSGFGLDVTKPVLRLARKYFDELEDDAFEVDEPLLLAHGHETGGWDGWDSRGVWAGWDG